VRVRATLGGVVVLALLGLAAAVVGAMLTPGGHTVAVPTTPTSSNAAPSPGGDTTDEFAREVVVVHVLGAVNEAGIVELPMGSRVVDAIAAARGPTDDADLGSVNLARIVVDGEQLVVPRVGEVPAPHAGAGAAGSAAGSTAGSAVDSQGRVNINTADTTALETLAGVGPALAARIIAWREQNGPFRSVDELTAVSGIGPATLDGMRNQVTL